MPNVYYDSSLNNSINTQEALMPTRLTDYTFSQLNFETTAVKNHIIESIVANNLTINLVVTGPKALEATIDQILLRTTPSIKYMYTSTSQIDINLAPVFTKVAEYTFKFNRAPIQTRLFLD